MSDIILTDEQKECISNCYSKLHSSLNEKAKQGNYNTVHSTLVEKAKQGNYDTVHSTLMEKTLSSCDCCGGVTDPYNGYEYVDLGDAGIWAKYPIGVSEWNSDWENNIKYFAWGETEGYTKSQVGVDKQFYSNWNDYKWGDDWNQLTKYCNDTSCGKDGYKDDITNLLPEDDAATHNMGGGWRTPTSLEFQRLNYINNEWVTNYNGVDGLNGILCTLTDDTSKQLFLPIPGHCENGSVQNVGKYGGFQTSDYKWDDWQSWISWVAGIYSYGIDSIDDTRCYGYPVIGILDTTN